MKQIEIEIDFKFTSDNIWPNSWNVNLKRYSNWAARTTLNSESGEEERVYLKEGDDVYWGVKDVKPGDVLAVGLRDTRKPRYNKRAYYPVVDINDEKMILLSDDDERGFTTIRKAIKAIKN